MRISRPTGDTGDAEPAVQAALAAFADGTGSEHAALTALAAARLLVPVVAVLAEAGEDGAEKETEMALPTLIGNDGRTAIIAFTGAEALRRWKEDARPVPVPARSVWAAARAEADAAVIDVAGPVQLVVEGARLAALAKRRAAAAAARGPGHPRRDRGRHQRLHPRARRPRRRPDGHPRDKGHGRSPRNGQPDSDAPGPPPPPRHRNKNILIPNVRG